MSAGVELKNVKRKESDPQSYRSSTDIGQVAPIYQEAIPPRTLPHEPTQYASPGPSSPTNEYDVIKDKAAGLRSTRRQQSENPLYGDHTTLPVAHPTLTVHETAIDKARNSSASATSLGAVRSERSDSPRAIKGERSARNCLLGVVLAFTLLVATGALVLAVLLFVGVKPLSGKGIRLRSVVFFFFFCVCVL